MLRQAVGLCGLLALLAHPAFAQAKDEERGEDPWTKNEPAAMEAAGILRFGNFSWGDDHGTSAIEETLGDMDLLWAETPHFRIASTLGEYSIPNGDRRQKKKLREELEELALMLPNLNPRKIRKLGPWLRLHLWAMRLEKTYAEVCAILQIEDGDFPKKRGELVNSKYMGEGPFMGMPEKFTLFIAEKESTLGRYANRYCPPFTDGPKRHLFPKFGSMMFGTAEEFANGLLKDDTQMHCHVVASIVHNLVDCYRFYWYALPVWIPEGLAHHCVRKIEPRFNQFTSVKEYSPNDGDNWEWEERIRSRVGHDYFPTFAKLMRWTGHGERKVVDHMMMWSRVDYLLEEKEDAFAAFLDEMTGMVPGHGTLPDGDQVLAFQKEAFNKTFGVSPDVFDEEWAAWVKKNYKDK